MSGIGGTELY